MHDLCIFSSFPLLLPLILFYPINKATNTHFFLDLSMDSPEKSSSYLIRVIKESSGARLVLENRLTSIDKLEELKARCELLSREMKKEASKKQMEGGHATPSAISSFLIPLKAFGSSLNTKLSPIKSALPALGAGLDAFDFETPRWMEDHEIDGKCFSLGV